MNKKDKLEKLNIELANIKRKAAYEKVSAYFNNVIRPFFPNCRAKHITDEYIDGVHLGYGAVITLDPINNQLFESDYYYDKNLEFIHYTTFNNCLNIIREKSLRMYNLNSMDDSFELKYASKDIFKGLNDEQIYNWKSNIYTFSMCEMNVENNKQSLDLWRRYGDDGKGVGVVIEVDKENQKTWYNRYLSRIQYGSNLIEQIAKRHVDFLKEQEIFHILGDYQELLLNLCCFHKPPIYETEKEIRYFEYDRCFACGEDDLKLQHLLTGNEFPLIFVERDKNAWEKHKKLKSPVINTTTEVDISKNMKPVRFKRIALSELFQNEIVDKIECPYVVKNRELFFPKFKIKKVILGYRYDNTDLENIKLVLSELALKNLGYEIELEITTLKEYF